MATRTPKKYVWSVCETVAVPCVARASAMIREDMSSRHRGNSAIRTRYDGAHRLRGRFRRCVDNTACLFGFAVCLHSRVKLRVIGSKMSLKVRGRVTGMILFARTSNFFVFFFSLREKLRILTDLFGYVQIRTNRVQIRYKLTQIWICTNLYWICTPIKSRTN